ncbi:MAG: DNA polymerase III subunit alpha, partial [Slackia sp.]
MPEVQERADYEMSVIIQQGFPAYFLIVQEYIEWARSQGIGVGPGRGSAAGAIVAYAMGITDLDPLSNGLLFERFLSPERVEMPDIDVDFEDERRQEVIEHIKDVDGEDHVSGVITFGKLQAKNAIRDAARVLGHPYGVGDRLCKMVGDELGITLESAYQPDLAAYDTSERESSRRVHRGNARRGRDCATFICRDPMADHVPMKRDTKGGGIITQYDGHYTPDLGLLKMDFLGLRTLGVLSRACRNIKDRFGVEIIPEEIPTEDEKAFELMQSGNMDGLFQVEGSLYVGLFARLPPKRFSDVVASIALNRPGPLESGMVEDYIKVASGKTPVHYYDDRLRPLLEETYGTMVYQEQIMQISMAMSGFS